MSKTAFATFPEFTKLNIQHRAVYEALIQDFSPIADTSFASVMTWWNSLGQAAVSILNGNLVISYWMPELENEAGLSLVGLNEVDESICTIFDHLKGRGEKPRLVGVPELVINNIRYHDLFRVREERRDCEYVVLAARYGDLGNMPAWKHQSIKRQLQRMRGVNLEVRPLNMQNDAERNMLMAATEIWWDKNINNIGRIERDAMMLALKHYKELGYQSVALIVEGRLRGFCIYRRPQDREYAVIHHIKATSGKMLDLGLISHLFAKHFLDMGVKYVNINTDGGNLALRMFMLTLGPVNFFRKYIVEPA